MRVTDYTTRLLATLSELRRLAAASTVTLHYIRAHIVPTQDPNCEELPLTGRYNRHIRHQVRDSAHPWDTW